MRVASTAYIAPNVTLGKDVDIGQFSVIGQPPRGFIEGELSTSIGDNAVIRSHSVVYAGNTIGAYFETGHGVSIRECNSIGDHVSIGTHSIIEHHVVIEDRVRIHSNVFIPEFSILHCDCWIGPCVTVTNVLHPKCPRAKDCMKGVEIGENAIIGANVTILPDVYIAPWCLVGSGSLVTKSLLDSGVYIGSPCKKIMEISEISCRYNIINHPYLRGDES